MNFQPTSQKIPLHYFLSKHLNFWPEVECMKGNPASESLQFRHARRKDRLEIENMKTEIPHFVCKLAIHSNKI